MLLGTTNFSVIAEKVISEIMIYVADDKLREAIFFGGDIFISEHKHFFETVLPSTQQSSSMMSVLLDLAIRLHAFV